MLSGRQRLCKYRHQGTGPLTLNKMKILVHDCLYSDATEALN